jgi:hypothetical protein
MSLTNFERAQGRGDTVTERDETYNGWRNYETWNVNLWLNNDDKQTYNEARYIARNRPNVQDSEDHLRASVESLVFGDDEVYGIRGDLLTHALGRVDWREIVAAFRED